MRFLLSNVTARVKSAEELVCKVVRFFNRLQNRLLSNSSPADCYEPWAATAWRSPRTNSVGLGA